MAAPREIFAQKETDFNQIIQSFHTLSNNDAKTIKPYYIALRKITPSDSLGHIAQNIPDFHDKLALLRILNGLDAQDDLPKNEYLKVINNKQ